MVTTIWRANDHRHNVKFVKLPKNMEPVGPAGALVRRPKAMVEALRDLEPGEMLRRLWRRLLAKAL